jgi:hypothetical protein
MVRIISLLPPIRPRRIRSIPDKRIIVTEGEVMVEDNNVLILILGKDHKWAKQILNVINLKQC